MCLYVKTQDDDFPWTRYWEARPAGDLFSANVETDGAGFLYKSSEHLSLPNLLRFHVVVLLGRPGSGKSTEVRRAANEGLLNLGGQKPVLREARNISVRGESVRDVMFARYDWEETKGKPVRLIVDGVDEILQEEPRFLNLLTEALKEQVHQRGAAAIHLLLTCRSAEWPETSLHSLWPPNSSLVATLCQLTPASAEAYVSHHLQSHASRFWQEVEDRNVMALAVWPQSLHELVTEFRLNDGKLPGTHFDLIRSAAKRRCDIHGNWDDERQRRLRDRDERFEIDWMFRVTGRIAALSIFTSNPSISVSTQVVAPGTLPLESWKSDPEPWSYPTIRAITTYDTECLERGNHFIRDGTGALRFDHQLFREHMAAAWIADRGLRTPQLDSLFGRRLDGRWRHYPQLAAVAAWLASDPGGMEWRQFLIHEDPTVLFRADASRLADETKREIAGALLNRAKEDGAIDRGIAHHVLRGLAFPGLADVLRPFIHDLSGASEAARELALKMTSAAEVVSLVPEIWNLMRKPRVRLRSQMVSVLYFLAKTGYDDEWKEVINGHIVPDADGELVGVALEILVPRELKVREVLDWLSPGRGFHSYGSFWLVTRNMGQHLESADAIPLIQLSTKHHASGLGSSEDNEKSLFSDAMVLLGDQLNDPHAMNTLVEWWLEAIRASRSRPAWVTHADSLTHPTLNQMGFEAASRRRSFLEAVAAHPHIKYFRSSGAHGFDEVIQPAEDTEWLVQKHDTSTNSQAEFWRELVWTLFWNRDVRSLHQPLLEQCCSRHAALRKRLGEIPEGVKVFDFLEGRADASRREQDHRVAKANAGWQKRRDEIRTIVEHRFEQAEMLAQAGDPRAWPILTEAIRMKSTEGRGGLIELSSVQITAKNPSWMLVAARSYLIHPPPSAYPDPKVQRGNNSGIEAIWSLRALWDQIETDRPLKLSVTTHWLPYIFEVQVRGSWEDDVFTVEASLRRFSPQSLSAFIAFLEHTYRNQGAMYETKHLAAIWSAAVCQAYTAMLMRVPLQPHGFRQALHLLADQDMDAAEQVANHWLRQIRSEKLSDTDFELLAAITTRLRGRLWNNVKPLLWRRPETARPVLMRGMRRHGFHPEDLAIADWPDDYLTDISELMIKVFPPHLDPPMRGGTVEPRDDAQMVRDHLITSLGERGLTDAVHRLQRLGLGKTQRWFSQVASNARSSQAQAFWKPLSSSGLLALARNHDVRLAQTNDDLTAAIFICIEHYQREIRSSARRWDVRDQKSLQVRDEEIISDYLAKWLEDELLLATNRESQTVKRHYTDIEVALTRPGQPPLHVTIEMKKNDSAELMEKMATQLRDKYLTPQNRTHGIYVVFWFEDGDANNHPGISTANDLKTALDRQAASLSATPLSIRSLVVDCRLALASKPNLNQTLKRSSGKPSKPRKKNKDRA